MQKFLFYNKFIIFLYMFRALLCLSSGGQNCIIQHLVLSMAYRGEVCGFQTPPPPEIPKALQNRAKFNPIVKTVKNG